MSAVTVGLLFAVLLLLIILSAFFSSSETGMMSVNRYRVSHLAKNKKNKAAGRVQKLLERPDRLLGVILIGNTFANILASSIATVLAAHYIGEIGVVVVTILLNLNRVDFCRGSPQNLGCTLSGKTFIYLCFTTDNIITSLLSTRLVNQWRR